MGKRKKDLNLLDKIMKIYSATITIKTAKTLDFVNITDQVEEQIKKSQVKNGLSNLFVQHTTAGLLINENDPTLIDDIKLTLQQLIPEQANYSHPRNSFSHQSQLFIPPYLTIPIEHGKLGLGTWQTLFLVELDQGGHRERIVKIQIFGE
jgi:secondary thiamine-phosphate synthase enzyme